MREWVRLYTSSWCHRKMLPLSLEAHGLWAAGLAYAGSQEREDFIPESFVMRVTRYGCNADERPEVSRPEELVTAGLWEPIEGGWLMHNHEIRQSDEEARKADNRIRQQRYRDARRTLRNADVTPVTRLEKSREEKNNVPKGTSDDVRSVFTAWLESTGKKATLTSDRNRVIRARLREGFTVDELTDAARGWVNDDWVDRPKHNDLSQLLRNAASVEKFRDLWRNGRPAVVVRSLPENPHDRRIREFGRGLSGLEVTA